MSQGPVCKGFCLEVTYIILQYDHILLARASQKDFFQEDKEMRLYTMCLEC